MDRAGELGADQELTILREVDAINNWRRERMVDLAREQCGGGLMGKRITVWDARVHDRHRRRPRLCRPGSRAEAS
ncbi:hypothetical protein ACIQVR_31590 [Streptomyces xanthochromogenes]|uniref:hypothetical protein n=1 Tax=Streptomyces xanthochromogenes TaxID=67384 RepID=UPI00380ECC52